MDYETMRLVQEREEVAFKIGHEVGYEKGLKKGKSIGSHQAYNKFVKHGRWIYDGSTSSGDYFKCSECNAHILLDESWKVSFKHVSDRKRYCHNCGAKMVEDCDEKV